MAERTAVATASTRAVSYTHLEQPERGGLLGEREFRQHGAHVIVVVHELPGVEAGVEDGGWIQDRERDVYKRQAT